MDLDDSREIRINSGQVIGLIMLLLAMLPRDIRSDLIDRLHRMTTQEMVDWYRTSTAASSERAGNSTVDPTSEGEIPESFPPATPGEHLSDGGLLSGTDSTLHACRHIVFACAYVRGQKKKKQGRLQTTTICFVMPDVLWCVCLQCTLVYLNICK